ncbi:MAG: MCE family protein [Acidimicrobiales bacterium]
MRNLLGRLPASAFKMGAFAVVCLVLLVALAVKIGNISLFSSRHSLEAQLADVTGLTTGDPVEIAGVPVGQVSSISVQHGHALVAMSIDNTVTLHTSTDVGLRWKNVIGQKEVYLYPGQGSGKVLTDGAILPLSHDVSDASVNAFLNAFGPFLSAIDAREANAFVENVSGALQGDTAEINQLIDNGAKISSTVGALDQQVGQVIGSLDQVLTAIAARSGDVSSLVSNLQTVAQSLASKNTVLDDVVGNLSQVAGDLSQLIGTNRSSLDATINGLETATETIAAHQQQLAQALATAGSGLAPYTEISSYGQWFEVQSVYNCLANQTSCSYYQSNNPPPGSGPLGGSPLPGSPPAPAASAPASPTASPAPLAQSSIADVLGAVAGSAGGGQGGTGQ